MHKLLEIWKVFTHLDLYLGQWSASMGSGLYVLLFLVIFAETGLVVTPFLPGDSLLFAIGALCGLPNSAIKLEWVVPLLVVAAIAGDAVNYAVGYRIGPKVFKSESSRWLNKKHLEKTQAFYDKYGGKTIIIARFVPIVRTFAPFVAGIGKMSYRRFALYNVVGGLAWVVLFTVAGYKFGNLDFVKKRFHYVIVAIIVLSVMPAVFEFLKERAAIKRRERDAASVGEAAES
jgi:membrane-associated protein